MLAAFQRLAMVVGAIAIIVWVFNNLPVGQWMSDLGTLLQSVFSGFGGGGAG